MGSRCSSDETTGLQGEQRHRDELMPPGPDRDLQRDARSTRSRRAAVCAITTAAWRLRLKKACSWPPPCSPCCWDPRRVWKADSTRACHIHLGKPLTDPTSFTDPMLERGTPPTAADTSQWRIDRVKPVGGATVSSATQRRADTCLAHGARRSPPCDNNFHSRTAAALMSSRITLTISWIGQIGSRAYPPRVNHVVPQSNWYRCVLKRCEFLTHGSGGGWTARLRSSTNEICLANAVVLLGSGRYLPHSDCATANVPVAVPVNWPRMDEHINAV